MADMAVRANSVKHLERRTAVKVQQPEAPSALRAFFSRRSTDYDV
jgi:hypothetical protein